MQQSTGWSHPGVGKNVVIFCWAAGHSALRLESSDISAPRAWRRCVTVVQKARDGHGGNDPSTLWHATYGLLRGGNCS